MNIKLNGEQKNISENLTVKALLDELKVPTVMVAVMVNDVIVKKDRFADTTLNDGDRVEVISFVGGG